MILLYSHFSTAEASFDMRLMPNDALWNLDFFCVRDKSNIKNLGGAISNDAHSTDVYMIGHGINFDLSVFEGRAEALPGYAESFVTTEGGRLGFDYSGIGTQIAAIVAARDVGVARKCKIYSVKVFDKEGVLHEDDLLLSFSKIKEHIQNKSISRKSVIFVAFTISPHDRDFNIVSSGASDVFDVGLDYFFKEDIPVVCPAGDGFIFRDSIVGPINSRLVRPSRNPKVITVGAHDQNNKPWENSNYGNMVDFFAPGTSILTYDNKGKRIADQGTAYAAAHVVGLCAMFLHTYPGTKGSDVKKFLNETAVFDELEGYSETVLQRDPYINSFLLGWTPSVIYNRTYTGDYFTDTRAPNVIAKNFFVKSFLNVQTGEFLGDVFSNTYFQFFIEGDCLSVYEESFQLQFHKISGPAWINVGASTGRVFGTAPFVEQDEDFSFTVNVSDGKYTLEVDFRITAKPSIIQTVEFSSTILVPVERGIEVDLQQPSTKKSFNEVNLIFSTPVLKTVSRVADRRLQFFNQTTGELYAKTSSSKEGSFSVNLRPGIYVILSDTFIGYSSLNLAIKSNLSVF